MPVPAELLLVLAAAFALRLAIYFLLPNIVYPDEIFQVTEPAHRLAFGTGLMSWEWHVGIRSWLLPGVFAALMGLGSLMGDAPWLVNLPVALFMVATSCVPVACAWGWGRAVSGRAGGFVAAGFCAVWIDLVYMSPHTLTEVVAANFLALGLYLGYAGEGVAASRRRLFWAGVMLGIAFVLRFHLSPALAVAAFGICGVSRGHKPWTAFLAGAAIPVAFLAVLDWATLGLPLQSIWLNFWLNVVVGVSKGAGVSPFATLFLMPMQIWGPIGFLLVAAAIGVGTRRLPLLLAVALAIFLSHSFIAHKEYRFIYPALPLLAILAGVGTSRILRQLLDARPVGQGRRAALAGVLVAGWSALSLSIGASDVFKVPWTRARSQLLAFEAISRDPAACGVGIYDMYWTTTGGHTWLPLGVRLYNSTAERLPLDSGAYNFIVAERGIALPDPSYEVTACFAGDRDHTGKAHRQDCVWRRPGQCTVGAAAEPGPIWDNFEGARRFLPEDDKSP